MSGQAVVVERAVRSMDEYDIIYSIELRPRVPGVPRRPDVDLWSGEFRGQLVRPFSEANVKVCLEDIRRTVRCARESLGKTQADLLREGAAARG